MINEKDITDDVMEQWKEINEEKEGLNEQTYKGSVLEERLRLTRQIFALEQENASLKDALEGYKQNAKWCDKCDKMAELKEQNRKLLESCEGATMMYEHLTKAKDLLLKLSTCLEGHSNNNFEYELIKEAEQFISEVGK